jgi:predicted lipoprotein
VTAPFRAAFKCNVSAAESQSKTGNLHFLRMSPDKMYHKINCGPACKSATLHRAAAARGGRAENIPETSVKENS